VLPLIDFERDCTVPLGSKFGGDTPMAGVKLHKDLAPVESGVSVLILECREQSAPNLGLGQSSYRRRGPRVAGLFRTGGCGGAAAGLWFKRSCGRSARIERPYCRTDGAALFNSVRMRVSFP